MEGRGKRGGGEEGRVEGRGKRGGGEEGRVKGRGKREAMMKKQIHTSRPSFLWHELAAYVRPCPLPSFLLLVVRQAIKSRAGTGNEASKSVVDGVFV